MGIGLLLTFVIAGLFIWDWRESRKEEREAGEHEQQRKREEAEWKRRREEDLKKRIEYKEAARAHIESLQPWAEKGVPEAQYRLGETYFPGSGTPGSAPAGKDRDFLDIREAIRWYDKAARKGHRGARHGLARALHMYIPNDIPWLRDLATRLGLPEAEYARGVTYRERKEYSEAVRWFRSAAQHGDIRASLALGEMYAYGEGVPLDRAQAASWFRKAITLKPPYPPKPYSRFTNAQRWLTIWVDGPAPGVEVEMKRLSDEEILVIGGQGSQRWHLLYGTRSYEGQPYYRAQLLPVQGGSAYFSHGGWLRLLDTRKGIVLGRWRFPGQIYALTPKGGHVQVTFGEEASKATFRQTLAFDANTPVPYWPYAHRHPARVPITEVRALADVPLGGPSASEKVPPETLQKLIPDLQEMVRRDPHSPWFRLTLGKLLKDLGS